MCDMCDCVCSLYTGSNKFVSWKSNWMRLGVIHQTSKLFINDFQSLCNHLLVSCHTDSQPCVGFSRAGSIVGHLSYWIDRQYSYHSTSLYSYAMLGLPSVLWPINKPTYWQQLIIAILQPFRIKFKSKESFKLPGDAWICVPDSFQRSDSVVEKIRM